jgi:tRNA (guanosine-2'-O-)-methyltransferase
MPGNTSKTPNCLVKRPSLANDVDICGGLMLYSSVPADTHPYPQTGVWDGKKGAESGVGVSWRGCPTGRMPPLLHRRLNLAHRVVNVCAPCSPYSVYGSHGARRFLALHPNSNAPKRFLIMTPEREQRIKEVMARRQKDLQVIIENVDDPHNLGAILRSCDAVGVGAVHLLYTKDKPPRMQELRTKSAASAVKWLEIKKWTSVEECVAAIGAPIYVATLEDRGRAPWECDLASACAIAVGNEHDGPTPELVAAAKGIITIPMQGFVESFNVSVATAICLAEAMRQRLASGKYPVS